MSADLLLEFVCVIAVYMRVDSKWKFAGCFMRKTTAPNWKEAGLKFRKYIDELNSGYLKNTKYELMSLSSVEAVENIW